MHLLLFDIDGTLVRVNDAGRKALLQAFSTLTDQPISIDSVPFSGRTDPAILRAVLAFNDLPRTEEAVNAVLDSYVKTMKETLSPDDVELLPGVRSLLSTLEDHPEVHLGLLTGNVEPIAYEKLSVRGLDDYFPVGAFGSDHADRNELASLALRRATAHTGHPFESGEQVVVIGDTAHDIECARAVGAQVVAVSTGRYGREELASHSPDLLLDSLRDTNAFVQQVLGH